MTLKDSFTGTLVKRDATSNDTITLLRAILVLEIELEKSLESFT